MEILGTENLEVSESEVQGYSDRKICGFIDSEIYGNRGLRILGSKDSEI